VIGDHRCPPGVLRSWGEPLKRCADAHARAADLRRCATPQRSVAGFGDPPATSKTAGQRPFRSSDREGLLRCGPRMVHIARLIGSCVRSRHAERASGPVSGLLWAPADGLRRTSQQRVADGRSPDVGKNFPADAHLAWRWHHRWETLHVYGSAGEGYIVAPHPPTNRGARPQSHWRSSLTVVRVIRGMLHGARAIVD
jgi:hypothetical protein